MTLLETAILVAVGLLVVFFIIRVIVETGKFLYNIAPLLIPLIIMATMLYYLQSNEAEKHLKKVYEHGKYIKEFKDKG